MERELHGGRRRVLLRPRDLGCSLVTEDGSVILVGSDIVLVDAALRKRILALEDTRIGACAGSWARATGDSGSMASALLTRDQALGTL
jgi:hypothetical protein